MKKPAFALGIFGVLLASCCLQTGCAESDGGESRLVQAIHDNKGLSSERTGADADWKADWKGLTAIARQFQKTDSAIAEQAVAKFARLYPDEELKVFILFRIIFDLPTNAPASQSFSFTNLLRFDSDVNPDGTVNLSWPLGWKNGKPYLIPTIWIGAGPPYRAAEEFVYMKNHFRFRDLDKVDGVLRK